MTTNRIIPVMVAVWLAVMGVLLFCTPVRARYFGWRLGHTSDKSWRAHYAERLSACGDAAGAATRRLQGHPDPNVRFWASQVAGAASGPWGEDCLLVSLSDSDEKVRDVAALALGRRSGDGWVPRAIDLAMGPNETTAAAAVFALQRNTGQKAIAGICRVLSESASVQVCAQAIESLGLLGFRGGRDVITARLKDQRLVPRMPANERLVREALIREGIRVPVQRGMPGPVTTAVAPITPRILADYAAEALRRLEREHTQTSQPTSKPSDG